MGQCRFCKKPAGFLRWEHRECQQKSIKGLMEIRGLLYGRISSALTTSNNLGPVAVPFQDLPAEVAYIARTHLTSDDEVKDQIITTWESSVSQVLEDGLLSEEEDRVLGEYADAFGLTLPELDRSAMHTRMTKAGILRSVMNGEIPSRLTIKGDLPINLQKGEQIIWAFSGVDYLEDKIKRTYAGRSQGVSVRIAKGVYYRVGEFKGSPIEERQTIHIDKGYMFVTNKNIYFSGEQKGLRIPYNKIIQFMPFDNGIGILKDNQTAKPQMFVTNDGWFTYNLIRNVAQI